MWESSLDDWLHFRIGLFLFHSLLFAVVNKSLCLDEGNPEHITNFKIVHWQCSSLKQLFIWTTVLNLHRHAKIWAWSNGPLALTRHPAAIPGHLPLPSSPCLPVAWPGMLRSHLTWAGRSVLLHSESSSVPFPAVVSHVEPWCSNGWEERMPASYLDFF